MVTIDKRSNGRWRVRIRNRRDPTLSKTFTRKTDALKQENNEKSIYQKIKKLHNYTIPEIITLKVNNTDKSYNKWLKKETSNA